MVLPDIPFWFELGEASWAVVLVLAHPDEAVRNRAWDKLAPTIIMIARGIGKHRASNKWFKVESGASALGEDPLDEFIKGLPGVVFSTKLNWQPVPNWQKFLNDLEKAMKPSDGNDAVDEMRRQAINDVSEVFNTYTPLKGRVEPWLYQVMTRLCLTEGRNKKKEKKKMVSIDAGGERADPRQRPVDETMLREEDVDSVLDCLQNINPDRLFRIRFFLLATCDWDIWKKVPQAVKALSPADRTTIGIGPTEEFPTRIFFHLEERQRRAEIERRLLALVHQGGPSSQDKVKQTRDRVEQWKKSGKKYLIEELAKQGSFENGDRK